VNDLLIDKLMTLSSDDRGRLLAPMSAEELRALALALLAAEDERGSRPTWSNPEDE
jgi:hypothetical protein